MYRPPEHLVHGVEGPVVILSARVCAYLNRYARLEEFRRANRGSDSEVDGALVAMRTAELAWRSARGTPVAPRPEQAPLSEWLDTAEAAELAGTTGRGIRMAIGRNRLKAQAAAGRWRIRRDDFEHWLASRAT